MDKMAGTTGSEVLWNSPLVQSHGKGNV